MKRSVSVLLGTYSEPLHKEFLEERKFDYATPTDDPIDMLVEAAASANTTPRRLQERYGLSAASPVVIESPGNFFGSRSNALGDISSRNLSAEQRPRFSEGPADIRTPVNDAPAPRLYVASPTVSQSPAPSGSPRVRSTRLCQPFLILTLGRRIR